MGKASRGKRRNITRDDMKAFRLAGELILDPRLIETFQSIKLHEKLQAFRSGDETGGITIEQPRNEPGSQVQPRESGEEFSARLRQQSPDTWAAGMRRGLRNPQFRESLNALLHSGQQALRSAPDFEQQSDPFNLDESARTRAKSAYAGMQDRLLADSGEPLWLTLAVACLARAIATNAHQLFAEPSWDDMTSFMYELEHDLLLADGEKLAASLAQFDEVFFEGRLPEVIGARMPFGLAELACNMADAALFNPAVKS